MKYTYLTNISIIASIFIFLILFLAIVNLYISIQLRNDIFSYEQNKIVSVSKLCVNYLNRYTNKQNLHYLIREVNNSFNLTRIIISDSLGYKVYDSWSIPAGTRFRGDKFNFYTHFKEIPGPDDIIQEGNNFLYHNTTPKFYIFASIDPAYSMAFDQIFRWHVFYITVSLIFVGFLGFFLIRNLFLPMRYAAKVAKELGVEMKKEDFVSETFNEIFNKIKLKEKMLEEFSAYIAHEFRNSIAAIIGLARLVEKNKKGVPDIIRECRSMEELISSLLEYSKPMKPMVSTVDVKQLINESVSKIPIPERISLRKNIKKDLPRIKGDYDLLQAAINNLLKNAIESIKKKGLIRIEADTVDDFICISITDSGCGLDTQDVDKIFSPFYTKKEKGMGLGLAYVNKIIELHNGKVQVETKKGKGTKFILYLPF